MSILVFLPRNVGHTTRKTFPGSQVGFVEGIGLTIKIKMKVL